MGHGALQGLFAGAVHQGLCADRGGKHLQLLFAQAVLFEDHQLTGVRRSLKNRSSLEHIGFLEDT